MLKTNNMSKKILLYNSFPFHNELFGFFFDYAQNKEFIVDVYCPHDRLEYFKLYQLYFKFDIINSFNHLDYDLVFVLTDSDWEYKREWINNKTITLDHWYQIRNSHIKHHIPVSPFNSNTYKENFIIPTYNIPELTYETKLLVKPLYNINIVIMGRYIPENMDELKFLKYDKIIFHIINCHGTHPGLKNIENVILYENVSTIQLFNILLNSQYIYITDKNSSHNKSHSTSAAIALSFTTGCQLIIPEIMNRSLRLKSAIIYKPDTDLYLNLEPDYELVFNEKKYLIDLRNKILDNLTMQLWN